MTHEEMIELIKAEMDGKQIQRIPKAHVDIGPFEDHSILKYGLPTGFIYQLKPELRVIWVNEHEHGWFWVAKSYDQAKHNADGCHGKVVTRKFIEVEE